MNFKGIWKSVVDILIPGVCLVCGKRPEKDRLLCLGCSQGIIKNSPPFCGKCGIHTVYGYNSPAGLCPRCLKTNYFFDKNYSPLLFREPASLIIKLFKYKYFTCLQGFLSQQLIRFMEENNFLKLFPADIITFVPLHKAKLREREYNQSALVAGTIAGYFNLRCAKLIWAAKYTKAQASKTLEERLRAKEGVFHCANNLSGKNVLLIDDVFTTGTTLSYCARALKDRNAKQVISLTIAITP